MIIDGFEITCICSLCEKKDSVDKFNVRCDECFYEEDEKYYSAFAEQLLNDLFEENDPNNEFIPSHLVGFKSEEEKILFLRGARWGYIHALWKIACLLGDEFTDKWETFSEEFSKVKINPEYDPILEKEAEEERKEA